MTYLFSIISDIVELVVRVKDAAIVTRFQVNYIHPVVRRLKIKTIVYDYES